MEMGEGLEISGWGLECLVAAGKVEKANRDRGNQTQIGASGLLLSSCCVPLRTLLSPQALVYSFVSGPTRVSLMGKR